MTSSTPNNDPDLTAQEFDVVASLMRLEIADAGLRTRLRDRLAVNATDLSAVQFIARAASSGRPVYAKDLAAVLGVSASAATVVVNRLVAAGHVTRTPDPQNSRYRLLALTADTTNRLADIIGDTQALLYETLKGMSDREKKRAAKLIDTIARALDDGAKTRPGLLDSADPTQQ